MNDIKQFQIFVCDMVSLEKHFHVKTECSIIFHMYYFYIYLQEKPFLIFVCTQFAGGEENETDNGFIIDNYRR